MTRLPHVMQVFTEPVTLSGFGQAEDGETVGAAGVRVLVTGNGVNNGIWITNAGAWTRAPDLATSSQFVYPLEIEVKHGQIYHDSLWYYAGDDLPVIGGDTLYFSLRSFGYPPTETLDDTTVDETAWTGLRVVYDGPTALTVEAGSAYISQTGTGGAGVVGTPDDTNMTGLVLTANTWYFLYCYEENGTLKIDPPSSQRPAPPYAGAARLKGGPDNTDPSVSPDPTRRYIPNSAFYAHATNTMRPFRKYPNGHTRWLGTINATASTGGMKIHDTARIPASGTLSTGCGPVVAPTSNQQIWIVGNILYVDAGAQVYAKGPNDSTNISDLGSVTAGATRTTFYTDHLTNTGRTFLIATGASVNADITLHVLAYSEDV